MAALPTSETIAVIGAGSMGAGIAQIAAAAGHPTLLFDINPDAVTRGIEGIGKGLAKLVGRGRMQVQTRDALLARIHPVSTLEALGAARLVIEAIVEDLRIKQDLFTRLESICDATTILATNTSSLPVTAIASALQRPQNLVGMHFFNPAPIMKLVEVISGVITDPAVAETVHDTASAWKKQPVLAASTPGFIVNRVARPYYAEALRLLEEQAADCATIDALLREAGGFRMGPFELMDLIGHDVNYAVTCSVFDAYYQDKRFLPSLIQKELVDGGLLGRKSGRGFYDYGESAQRPEPRTEAAQDAPASIEVVGSLGVAEPMVERWQQAGIRISRVDGDENCIRIGNSLVALSDGRCATLRAAENRVSDTILFDLALDYTSAGRIALAAADQASGDAKATATGLFQAAGMQVSIIDDVPGMLIMRSVCMLANEGADAVLQGVCDEAAVDTAMRSGVNYPQGPLAWADQIGLPQVLQVLIQLQTAYGIDRYRPSQLLRRRVAAATDFHRQE